MILPSPVALLFSLALGMSASAAPVVFDSHHLLPRTVWSPRIITPTGKTVWKLNSEATVTWDPSNPPPLAANNTGMVLLGHLNEDGSGGENLDVANPLAQGFKLAAGTVTFPVPKVTPNDNYIVVLFGDSGNASPKFTISGY